MKLKVALYLIPVNISDAPLSDVLPQANIEIVKEIKFFIVENIRTARRFLKKCDPSIDIDTLSFFELNRHTDSADIPSFLEPLREGSPIGVMSEAGCPGVADPGAVIVEIAQRKNFEVIPLIGPSSILLSLMGSGFNGQSFSFNGYLPIEQSLREKKLRELEDISLRHDMTQIFIETPYRNNKLLETMLKTLKNSTKICIACSITDPGEQFIRTFPVAIWKKKNVNLDKRPTIFLIYSR